MKDNLHVSPITRISKLLARELCKRKPNSRIVMEYSTAINELCNAQTGLSVTTHYQAPDSIKRSAEEA